MNESTSSSSEISGSLTVTELSARFLKFVESVKTTRDINLSSVNAILQVPMEPLVPEEGSYLSDGELADGSSYSLTFQPGTPQSQAHSVSLSFTDAKGGAACLLDFASIDGALQSGSLYTAAPSQTSTGLRGGWTYFRADDITVSVGVDLVANDAEKKLDRVCAISIYSQK